MHHQRSREVRERREGKARVYAHPSGGHLLKGEGAGVADTPLGIGCFHISTSWNPDLEEVLHHEIWDGSKNLHFSQAS